MRRRDFFKVVAGGVVGVLAAPVMSRNEEKGWMQTQGPCYSYIYGDPRKPEVCGINAGKAIKGLQASKQLLGSRLVLPDGSMYVCVKFVGNHKVGQVFVWNPDGTVRRV